MINNQDKKSNFKLLQFSFTPEQVYPEFIEKTNKDYVSYGAKNDYPLQMIELKNQSAMHNAIITSIASQIVGKGLKIKDDVNDIKLQEFIDVCNSRGESLYDVLQKIVYDYVLFGGWSSSIVWKRSQEQFELYHTDFSTIRSGKVDEKGLVNEYYFSENWKSSKSEIKEINAFSIGSKRGTQLYYYKKYSPNNVYYPLPDYIGTINWILLDIKISEFFNSYLDSGCFPSLYINYNNGIPSDDVKDEIYNSLLNEYQGSAQAGKVIVSFSEGKDSSPDVIPLNNNNDDAKFGQLSALVNQQMLSGWRITSPELIGIQTAGKLGTSSIIEAQQLFYNTVILPKQSDILKEINFLLRMNGFQNEIEIINVQPVEFSLSENTMTQIMTINELRGLVGVEPIENGDRFIGSPLPVDTISTPNTTTDITTIPTDATQPTSNITTN